MLTYEQQQQVERLMPYTYKIAGSFGSDDEYVSEAMVALCEAVPKHDPSRGPLDPFVGTCIRNRLKRLLQKKNARPVLCDTPEGEGASRGNGLYEALAQLDEPYRSVADLHWVQGISIANVAEELGLTQAETRRKIAAAKQRLASILENQCR